MKKSMLGTTMLVAANTLTAGTLAAADPMKLGIKAYMHSSFFFVDFDDDDPDRHDTRVMQEGEVAFTAATTLDNGLTFGVNIQLEARESADQVDETYVYTYGSFGRINLGSEDSAPYLMQIAAPSPVPAWSVNDNSSTAVGDNLATAPNELGDADKITYFTPRFSGFQLGASYTPDASSETGTHSPYALPNVDTDEGTAWSIAANYVNSFNDVSVSASLGYQTIRWDNNSASDYDVEETAVGASVGFADFTVGASYKHSENDDGIEGTDREDWNVGVTYGMGPWKVGVQYGGAEYDSDTSTNGEETHAVVVGGQYTLGPGVTVFGAIQLWDIDDDFAAFDENGNHEVYIIGTALRF